MVVVSLHRNRNPETVTIYQVTTAEKLKDSSMKVFSVKTGFEENRPAGTKREREFQRKVKPQKSKKVKANRSPWRVSRKFILARDLGTHVNIIKNDFGQAQ